MWRHPRRNRAGYHSAPHAISSVLFFGLVVPLVRLLALPHRIRREATAEQRNVTARITAVGGKISIHSVPGVGTTIDGSVPLPRGGRPVVTVESIAPTEVRTDLAEQTLLDQVRAVAREARELYDGSAESGRLRAAETQLDEPLPVGTTRVGDIRRAERSRRIRSCECAYCRPDR